MGIIEVSNDAAMNVGSAHPGIETVPCREEFGVGIVPSSVNFFRQK